MTGIVREDGSPLFPSPMTIAVLLHGGAGGSGVVATELGLRFAQAGHAVHFVANRVPFRLNDRCDANVWVHQVETMAYPLFDAPLTTLAQASKLAEVIETYGVDVVHAHYAVPHATAAVLAREMVEGPAPAVVTTLHGTDVTLIGIDRAYLRATRHAVNASDAVTAVSRHLRDHTLTELGVDREVAVIPNAVDVQRFRPGPDPDLRRRFARDDEALLLHVSNFRPVKRTCDVVRIFAALRDTHPVRLAMVGDGPEQHKAADLARTLGVHDATSFVGAFPRIEALMRTADLFLLPSEQEAFGLVALEAMASGVPVVASDAGGLPEVVLDRVTGRVLPVGDVGGMTAAARELLSDAELRARMATAARERAVVAFAEEDVVRAYARTYVEAMSRATSGR
ncbi:MAG: N-acetyl-alpha-D-glucosaminyl L-malate synthase BshA [Trueperaceae bacterium]